MTQNEAQARIDKNTYDVDAWNVLLREKQVNIYLTQSLSTDLIAEGIYQRGAAVLRISCDSVSKCRPVLESVRRTRGK